MGDRCYVQVTLHGHVKSVAVLDKIEKAMSEEQFQPVLCHSFTQCVTEAVTWGNNPSFYADEVNYCDIDELETVLQMLKIAYRVDQRQGDSYGAQCWSWTPENGQHISDANTDGSPVLDARELNKTFEESGVNALMEVINDALRAAGDGMPTFSVSDDVKRALAIRAAEKALNPEAA